MLGKHSGFFYISLDRLNGFIFQKE